ncbi:hypothetical protein [Streptomyces sp. NBC_00459]|uniref:hypothetical protein n=1 Tax=Streptomyces sp. NBC_00459 TaxID=2975749 RepID=UPI002E1958C2
MARRRRPPARARPVVPVLPTRGTGKGPPLDRIAEAQREGWLAEVEGLEISLAGAEEKLAQLNAALKPSVIHLGLPAFGQIAGWSSTL